jgi:exodeoxyribonuclease VII small subunit
MPAKEPRVESGPDRRADVAGLSYAAAGSELDAIIEEFETGVVDVDRLVEQLERATDIVDELDRRLRRTRMQVEELVPRLEAIGRRDEAAPSVGDAGPDAEEPVDDDASEVGEAPPSESSPGGLF